MSQDYNELIRNLRSIAKEKGAPLSAAFELTPRCNLKCKMCYVCRPANDKEAKAKELTADQWVYLAKEARDAGLLYLTLTGGEVFLRQDFREIYEPLTRLGLNIQIFTNATLITPDIVKWISFIPPSKISITLYGQSRETYEKVTGYANAYDRTLNAIDALQAAGILTEMKTTVIRDNYKEFDQIYKLSIDRKIKFGIVNYVSPRREGTYSDPQENRLSPEELVPLESHISKINVRMEEDEESGILLNEDVGEAIKSQPNPKLMSDFNMGSAFRCDAGKTNFWITWDGRMTPCGLMDKPFSYPLKDGFQVAWEQIRESCLQIPTCLECVQCDYRFYCESCPARLYTETGSHTKPAPYLCQIARLRVEDLRKLKVLD